MAGTEQRQKKVALSVRVSDRDRDAIAAKAKEFVEQHQLTYPAVVDSGTLSDQYTINGMPVGVFIDRRGIVRKIEIGQLSSEQLDADIKSIL